MTWLRHAGAAVGRAVGHGVRSPGASALVVASTGTVLALAALVHLAALNVSSWTSSWGGGVQMVVYLEADAGQRRADERDQAEEAGVIGGEGADFADRFVDGQREAAERNTLGAPVVFVGPGGEGEEGLDAVIYLCCAIFAGEGIDFGGQFV